MDGDAGIFDEHSRRLPESSLAALLKGDAGVGRLVRLNALDYDEQRILGTEGDLHSAAGKIMAQANVRPEFAVQDSAGHSVVGIETHEFRNGGVTIVGLHNNPQMRVDELGPPEFKSNQRFEKQQKVRLVAPVQLYAYDVRAGKKLVKAKEFELTVDPYEPTVLAFSAVPFPELEVNISKRIERGATGRVGFTFAGASSAEMPVLHLEVLDPSGHAVPYYSGNLLAPDGSAEKVLNVAENAPVGKWTLRVRDVLSGQSQTRTFDVQ